MVGVLFCVWMMLLCATVGRGGWLCDGKDSRMERRL
jgi:hypothetical protein